MRSALALSLAVAACSSAPAASTPTDAATADRAIAEPAWLDAKILVRGDGVSNRDCRTGICQHNENTDLIAWKGAIWLVHRTATSQILGPNSALHVYKSTDGGASFVETARLPAPTLPEGRDLRDPHFYVVGDVLHLKALIRLPVLSERDSRVETLSVETHSSDGATWSAFATIAGPGWSLWRVRESGGVYYSAAYQDGDLSVKLYSSPDGTTWTPGADLYTVAADTPLETELTFFPSGKLLALVRLDGTNDELLGDRGRLRTKICRAAPPYASFDCTGTLDGQRLDGPLTFFHAGRLFVVARKHLQGSGRKRTALFELTAPGGILDGGALSIRELGELPSASDTAYAGVAEIDRSHVLLSWYSGALDLDENWTLGMLDATDIWQGVLDFSKL